MMFLAFQIALQFPYRFWDSKAQGADYFGHVPPSPEKRGMFSVFYDMRPKVRALRHIPVMSFHHKESIIENIIFFFFPYKTAALQYQWLHTGLQY